MNVLVTGANGYLGRGIVKALLDFGEKVTATDFSIDGIDERANHMADAEKFITRKYGEDTAYILFEDNPARIIDLI